MNNQLYTQCHHGLQLWFEEFSIACTTSFQLVQQSAVSRVGVLQKVFRLSHTLFFQALWETPVLFFKRHRPTGKFLKYIEGKGNNATTVFLESNIYCPWLAYNCYNETFHFQNHFKHTQCAFLSSHSRFNILHFYPGLSREVVYRRCDLVKS